MTLRRPRFATLKTNKVGQLTIRIDELIARFVH